MANFFSLQDGNLTDASVYGYSLTGAEIMNNTTGAMLLTSNLYSGNVFIDGSAISSIAVHLSARAVNPTGTLNLTLQRTASAGTFLDSSSNNLTITTVGSAYQSNFTPFSPNGWSGYFNGTSDQLYIANNTLFDLGTNPFTIEFWWLPTKNTDQNITGKWNSSSQWILQWRNTGVFRFAYNSSTVFDCAYTLPIGTWLHFAISRDSSNNGRMFVNGVQIGTTTTITTINATTDQFNIGTSQNGTNLTEGTISNFRLVKGTALYTTSNFTPSASPLTNIANTSLLTLQNNRLKDNSTNNFTISGTVAIKDTSPFTPVIIDPIVHGGTGVFGSGTYLSIPSNPSINIETSSNFTVEAWVYPTVNSATGAGYICTNRGAGNTGYAMELNTNNILRYYHTGGSAVSATQQLSANRWYHVAATRSGTTCCLFINGIYQLSGTISNGGAGSVTYIGCDNTPNGNNFNGYISNLRIIKDTTLYTAGVNFTPSASPLTNITGTSLLLNTRNYGVKESATETYAISSFTSYDGSNNLLTPYPQNWQILKLTNPLSSNRGDVINYTLSTSSPNQLSLMGAAAATDTTGVNKLSTVGSPTLTSFKPYPNFDDSLYLNGSTDWVVAPPNRNFNLAGDFTIETWVNTTAAASATDTNVKRIFSFGALANNNLEAWFYISGPNGSVNLSIGYNTTTFAGSIVVANSNWHHIAVVRYNGVLKLYVDGQQSITPVANATVFNAGVTSPLSIGSYNNTTAGRLSGYINQFRIVNGTAVYTTSAFTPPTTPLTNIPNTVFLMKNGARYDQVYINSDISSLTTSYLISSVGGPVTLSSASPFGVGTDGSMMLSGVPPNTPSNYLLLSSASISSEFATSDFTMEGWFNFNNAAAGYQPLISYADDAVADQRGLICIAENNNTIYLYATNSAGSWPYSINSGFTPTAGVWTHIAVVRYNGYLYLYINGISRGTPANIGSNAIFTSATTKLKYGQYERFLATAVRSFGGFISNIRVSKRALYLTNFTPSNKPLNNGTFDVTLTYPYSLPFNASMLSAKIDDIHMGSSLKGLNRESRTIIVDTYPLNNIYIHNQGTLTFPLTSSKTLTLNGSAGLQITSDGTLNIGTSSEFIPLSTTHTITINLSNTQIDVHNGGNLNVYGYPKLFTTNLVSDYPIGTNTFTVTDPVSSIWKVGDILTFKPNLTARTGFDTLTIASFTGSNTLSTTSNSLFMHMGSASYANIAGVYNLNKNVIIRGLNSQLYTQNIRANNNAKVYINNAQIYNLFNYKTKSIFTTTSDYNGVFSLSSNCISSIPALDMVSSPVSSYSVYFEGTASSGYVYMNNSSYELIGINSTVECFFNQLSTNSNNGYICTKGGVAGQKVHLWSAYIDSNNTLYISIGTGTASGLGVVYTPVAKIFNNTWYHLAIVRTNNGATVSVYLNGVLVSTFGGLPAQFTEGYDLAVGTYTWDNTTKASNRFCGYISNFRILSSASLYTSNFTPPKQNLSAIPDTILLTLQNNTFIDNSVKAVTISNTLPNGVKNLMNFSPFVESNVSNVSFNNNILINNGFSFSNFKYKNIILNNNYILNSPGIGLQIVNSTGSINMSNNTTIGSLSYGTYIANNTLTGTYGANNFNSGLQGMYVAGTNTGTIVGGGLNSPREGVYVDASTSNLSGLTFQNILANNNSSVGFKVSGNNLNYLTPVTLNINGLVANTNLDSGFEGYNIAGNLSSIVANNNIYGIKTSIGNGPTIFDGLSSTISTPISTLPIIPTGTSLSANSPYDPKGWCAYFDTTNYIKLVGSSTAFSFPSKTFTIEAWFNLAAIPATAAYGILGNYKNGSTCCVIQVTPDAKVNGYLAGDTKSLSGTTTLSINTWYHIAIAGSTATGYKMFLNGVQQGGVYSSTVSVSGVDLEIGAIGSALNPFNGYISNVRILNDVILYTNNFTPSSSPLTNISGTSLLALQNSYLKDTSNNNYALSSIGTLTLSAGSPFTTGSLSLQDYSVKFNGTSDYINIPHNSSFTLGSSDFTIECWVNVGSYPNDYNCFLSKRTTTTGFTGYIFCVRSTGYFGYLISSSTGTASWGVIVDNIAAKVQTNTWYHVALVRYNNTLNFYVNGTLAHTTAYNVTMFADTASITLGAGGNVGGQYFNGYVSNFRLINGVGIYTSNFIPPAAPLNRYLNSAVLNATYYQLSSVLVAPPISLYNTTALNILSGYNYSQTVIKNSFLSATSVNPALSAAVGLSLDSTRFGEFSLDNSTLCAAIPLQLNTTRNILEGSYLFNNTILGSTPLGSGITSKYQSNVFRNTGFAFTNLNKISAYNVTYLVAGSRMLDYVTPSVQTTDVPSERLTPSSSTIKLRSGSKFIAVNAGDTTNITVYIRTSILSDGTAYNGNPPRLILKRNPAVGVYSDTVLAQLDSTNNVSGSYVLLTESTPASIDDGVFELYIDCDGTDGWINIDNWNAV